MCIFQTCFIHIMVHSSHIIRHFGCTRAITCMYDHACNSASRCTSFARCDNARRHGRLIWSMFVGLAVIAGAKYETGGKITLHNDALRWVRVLRAGGFGEGLEVECWFGLEDWKTWLTVMLRRYEAVHSFIMFHDAMTNCNLTSSSLHFFTKFTLEFGEIFNSTNQRTNQPTNQRTHSGSFVSRFRALTLLVRWFVLKRLVRSILQEAPCGFVRTDLLGLCER